jgi:DNA invertase Pin-like site-specific DNA recombinase
MSVPENPFENRCCEPRLFSSLRQTIYHPNKQLVVGTIVLDSDLLPRQSVAMENEKQLRIALYARVSTRDKGQDPELQLSELREYAKARGWHVTGEFVDQGVSGAKDSRPQLDAMMRLAKSRKIDVVAVWKLDRFGRSLRHLVDALAEMEAVGVAFVSLRDNLDMSTPAGRLMFHVIGAMAEFERSLIQERVKAGLAHARSKGTTLGRPKVKRERDKDAKRIRQMREEGQSYREIAEELGRSTMDVYRVGMTLGCSSGY